MKVPPEPSGLPARIRNCEERDLDAVFRLQQELAAEDIIYGFAPDTLDGLRERRKGIFLVAESADGLLGYAFASSRVSDGLAVIPAGQNYVELDELYVRREFRGKGLGGQLLSATLQAAGSRGIDRFLLYSAVKDLDAALRFYRKHGFKSWYVQMFR